MTSYLIVVLGLGYFTRCSGKGKSEFFLAGRSMSWFPIGLSVMVTIFSAVNYLAMPSEVFGYGLYVIAALPVFFLVAFPVTKIWMPFFHDMQLTSAYEYLEKRFDTKVRILGSVMFLFWRLFWMATALYAAGKVMGLITQINPAYLIIVCGLIATVYTTFGGIKAVMWTDVLQFFVLFGGIALGLFYAIGDTSISEFFAIAFEGGRLKPFYPFDIKYVSFEPTLRMTLWSGLIGVSVAFLARYGSDQVVMQRYFTAKDLSNAQRGMWFSALVSFLSLSLLVLFGLAIYVNAVNTGALSGIDWNALSPVQKKGIAMKQFVAMIRSFPPGVMGLVVSGLLAATMSSIDSGVNACSASFMVDIYPKLLIGKKILSKPKILTFILGVCSTGLALLLIPLVGKTHSLFMIINKVINALGSPLLALFLLGMFTKRANAEGLFAGGIMSVIFCWVCMFKVSPLALQYYAVLNLIISLVCCYSCSRLWSNGKSDSTMNWYNWNKNS
jgi:SSS family transporter